MLLALLPDRFPAEVQQASYEYYLSRCGHGSSLSPSIHALVSARLGRDRDAARFFQEAGAIDLDDTMGNAAGGVHIAAQGGLWQAAVFGFAGLSAGAHGLQIEPRLPARWHEIDFRYRWRGRRARIAVDAVAETVTINLEDGAPLPVRVGDISHVLQHGETWTAAWPAADGGRVERAAA
jgi:trehalose/maltose hydrolase-like predicted phosphorylase